MMSVRYSSLLCSARDSSEATWQRSRWEKLGCSSSVWMSWVAAEAAAHSAKPLTPCVLPPPPLCLYLHPAQPVPSPPDSLPTPQETPCPALWPSL